MVKEIDLEIYSQFPLCQSIETHEKRQHGIWQEEACFNIYSAWASIYPQTLRWTPSA